MAPMAFVHFNWGSEQENPIMLYWSVVVDDDAIPGPTFPVVHLFNSGLKDRLIIHHYRSGAHLLILLNDGKCQLEI